MLMAREKEKIELAYQKAVDTEDFEGASDFARKKRRFLIEETDNYCLTDRPQPSEAMLAYRQHLRDIPEQEGFPYEIDWGVKPEV